jgi:hypothetical protein
VALFYKLLLEYLVCETAFQRLMVEMVRIILKIIVSKLRFKKREVSIYLA